MKNLPFRNIEDYDCWEALVHFIVGGSIISPVRWKYRCYNLKNYFQCYYVSNPGKYFTKDTSQNMSAWCMRSTHSM